MSTQAPIHSVPGILCDSGAAEKPSEHAQLESILERHFDRLTQQLTHQLDAWLVRQEEFLERPLRQQQAKASPKAASKGNSSSKPKRFSVVPIKTDTSIDSVAIKRASAGSLPGKMNNPPPILSEMSQITDDLVLEDRELTIKNNHIGYVPGITRGKSCNGRDSTRSKVSQRMPTKGTLASQEIPNREKKNSSVRDSTSRGTKLQSGFASGDFDQFDDVNGNDGDRRINGTTFTLGGKEITVSRVVMSLEFEICSALLIGSNAVLIGIEVDYLAKHPYEEIPSFFRVAGVTYSTLFFMELVMRILANGCLKFFTSGNIWNYLDTGIVASSLLEIIIDTLAASTNVETGSSNLSHLRVLRMVRMTRLARVFRIVRVVRFVRPLKLLIISITHTMKSVFWAFILLIMIFYAYGSLFTQATTDHFINAQRSSQSTDELDRHQTVLFKYWGTVPRSMYTLFFCISNGISWSVVEEQLSEINSVWVVLLSAFIFLTVFAVLNVVTGIFCQSAIDSAKLDHESVIQAQLQNKRKFNWHLHQTFQIIDEDQSGTITWEEFDERLGDPEFAAYINSLDLDVNDARALFDLLASEGSEEIQLEDFAKGIQKLRGSAQAIELAKVMSIVARVEANILSLLDRG